MDRAIGLDRLASETDWDFLVIGGGATGLGAGLDAAARGYRVALVESGDFAQGTSSRSTKLVHGGVRYLKQGNISLVRGALRERGLLFRNAPRLVKPLSFVIPCYRWWERMYFATGLMLYDRLAGSLGIQKTRVLDREAAISAIPKLRQDKLYGGVEYYDGQFDDARLAIDLANTIWERGGLALNYIKATDLIRENGRVAGAVCVDQIHDRQYELKARCVINASGVFSDSIRKMDNASARGIITASQGAHIVVDQETLPMKSALIVPKTTDGRVLFAIPWRNRVIVGTTDTPVDRIEPNPAPFSEEIEFIIENAKRHLNVNIGEDDIKSVYAGLRPLVNLGGKSGATSKISRDHHIEVSDTGLVTIAGGKWTTYRKMGEDVISRAESVSGLDHRPCQTAELAIHSAQDADSTGKRLHPDLPYSEEQLKTSLEHEMPMTIEDVLSRRIRASVLDAKAASEIAPFVAHELEKLGRLPGGGKAAAIEEFRALNDFDLEALPPLPKQAR